MLPGIGLTHGELAIVLFVTVAVLSARYWPKVGERIAERLAGSREKGSKAE